MSNLTIAKQTSVSEELAAALAAVEHAADLTPTGLALDEPTISYENWVRLGEALRKVRSASSWWLGDWYIFGGTVFGEDKAVQAADVTGLTAHTLATIVRTCMYVPRSRRILDLPFAFHSEVAKMVPEEQTRFLQMALDHKFTREQLRQAIREYRHGYQQLPPETEPQFEGAKIMKRQLDVEKIAHEIYVSARRGPIYWMVQSELMTRLGDALGEEEGEA